MLENREGDTTISSKVVLTEMAAAMMESDAYEASVKKSKETMETFRDTTGPMKSYNHVFEATTSIGKFSMSFLQRLVCVPHSFMSQRDANIESTIILCSSSLLSSL